MGRDGGIEGGGQNPLVLGMQVVGELVEVADPADHRRTGDDLVDVRRQLGQERHVLGVALDKPIGGMVVVALRHPAVLAEVVDADNLVAVRQELIYEVAADETSGACDEDPHRRMPWPVTPHTSTTSRPPTSRPRYARCGAPSTSRSASAITC